MEEPEKACQKQENQKKKMVIKIGKSGGGGGGGGGVGGIIFLAGVLATAAVASTAALTLKRRHQKTSTKSNNYEIPSEIMEDSNNNGESTKGLHILVSDFPPEEHHELSGTTKQAVSKTDLTCLMTSENLIMDNEKIASGIGEGKEGPISIGEEVLIESYSSLDDDFKITKDEFPSLTTRNLLYSESDSMKKPVAETDIQVIKHHHKNQATLADQPEKDDDHVIKPDSDRLQVEVENGDLNREEVEISMEVYKLQKIQLDEQQQETLTSAVKENITIEECSKNESSEAEGKELLPRSYEKLNNEVIERDEIFEVAKGDRMKDDTDLVQVESCDQYDKEILEPNYSHDFRPANLTCISSKLNQQPTKRVEVTEEYVAEELLGCKDMIEEGNPTTQLIEKEQGDGGEVIDADIIMSEDDSMEEMSDEAGNTEDNETDDEGYNDYMNILMAEDDLIVRMSDEEKIAQENEIYDDHYDDDDDDDDDEEAEDNTYEINGAETFEVSSPDTVDSSLESNAEAIWPIETISFEELNNKVKETAEEEENIDCKSIGPGNTIANGNEEQNRDGKPKLVLVEKSMMDFAAQHDPIPKSIKWRILIGIMSVLLLSLCFQYFDLPFEKLSL